MEDQSVPISRPTEAEIETAFEKMQDGRARCIKEIHPDVPVGKIYASYGNGVYWTKKKWGYIEHKHRGADLDVRKGTYASLSQIYERRTGKTAVDMMEKEQAFIDRLEEAANQIEDPKEFIELMEKVARLQQKFNTTWAPYLESKLGQRKVETSVEKAANLDDILNGKVIEHEDSGSK